MASVFYGCHFTRVGAFTAAQKIKAHHYLHTMPAGILACYAMCKDDSMHPVAVCVFSNGRIQFKGRYVELSRMWVDDEYGANAESEFMGHCLRAVGRLYKDHLGVISYSDPHRGHTGTIYKAANFVLDGESRAVRMRRDLRTRRMVPPRSVKKGHAYAQKSDLRPAKKRWVYYFDASVREQLRRGMKNT